MQCVYYDLGLLIYFAMTFNWFQQVFQVSNQYLILLSFLSSVMIKTLINLSCSKKKETSSVDSSCEKISCLCNEFLPEKDIWKIHFNADNGHIVEKNISMNGLIEFLRDDCDKDDETYRLDERHLLEKLLQNIILKDDYISNGNLPGHKPSKHTPSFDIYPLEQIFQILKSLNISESTKANNFIEIGFILSENANFVKFSKVLIRHSKKNSSLYEMIFLHSKIEKKLIPIKMDVKKKIMTLCKIADEIKNIILVIIRACNNSNNDPQFIQNESRYYLSNLNEINQNNDRPHSFSHKKTLDYVKSLSNSLLFHIENLNTFTKLENDNIIQAASMSEIEFIPALESCLETFSNLQKLDLDKSNLEIISKYECNKDLKILTNEAKLKQVLINLLSNAYKFTASGKIILGAIFLKEEKKLRISVSDTGCGISEPEKIILEKNENIDEPGLGLSIVKEFLSQMGSDLKFKSTKNEGSIFWFDIKITERLPKISLSSLPSLQNENFSKDSRGKNTILSDNALKLLEYNNNISNANSVSYSPSLCPGETSQEIRLNENLQKITKTQIESLQIITDSERNQAFRKINPSKFKKDENFNKSKPERKQTQNTLLVDFLEDIEVEEDNIIDYINCKYHQKSIHDLKIQELKKVLKLESSEEMENRKKLNIESQISISEFQDIIKEDVCTGSKIYPNDQMQLKSVLNIIVCDDERTTLHATSNLIKKITRSKNIDVNIITCSDGIECLYEVCKGHSNKNDIGIVFIDECMPFIRGSLVTNLLKTMAHEKQIKDILVYVVTAYEDEENIKMIKSRNCDGIINKPITATRLKDILK